MKKTILTSALLAMAGVGLMAGNAMAVPTFGFEGNFTIKDSGNGTPFLDQITFTSAISPGSAGITAFSPATDALFSDLALEYVTIAPLFMDEANPFFFNPVVYTGGFQLFDDNGDSLFVADLTPVKLETLGGAGIVNSGFHVNLTNIKPGASYTSGDSVIVDSFLAGGAGMTMLTLQCAISNLADEIKNVGGSSCDTIKCTYSGVAAPVPEPATMLLFGTGIASLAGVIRRRRNK